MISWIWINAIFGTRLPNTKLNVSRLLWHGQREAVLYDTNGREILDLISSWWTITHGHSHPALVETLAKQGAELCHVMFSGFKPMNQPFVWQKI